MSKYEFFFNILDLRTEKNKSIQIWGFICGYNWKYNFQGELDRV